MKTDRFLRTVIFSIVLAGALWNPAAAGPPQVPPASPESPAFRDFTQRVQEYVKLQKTVPRLRTTKHRKEIVERRRALAQKIREMRANAKQGDIFTPEVSEEFQRVIRRTFRGPNAARVRKTIRPGEPVPAWHPTINADYPESRPLITLPPTLLRSLPQLPPEVAYRIDGHDFILQDVEARVVIDFIPGAVP